MDLNVACPTELKVTRDGESVACNSKCKTRALPCLSSEFFKSACPNDRASFTCVSADYIITFCPRSSKRRVKAGNDKSPAAVGNNNMIAVVAASVALLFGVMVFRITIFLSGRGWSIRVVAGTRVQTIDPNNPQPEPLAT
ncbi:uncharacterized protein LOC109794253 [Cajanus cajan]|uniref:uncharacterized protein LOC109794253 n=1 Tax=Cajanus cajan TaxID=3821 RepID=UPI00098DC52B|nr:uncharacterized protein LOC109794253 [Cajanus cajan]